MLSLSDLLQVEVTTVSKKAENPLDAPGIISVITADEIATFGASNLIDVLQRIPNLFVFDSPTFTATGVSLRAGATQHLNNHVLYLINERPLRESQNGGFHSDINLLFPVELIERIEVIRGPGSDLYGSNAFSGTINFITKKAKPSGKVHLSHIQCSESLSHSHIAYLHHFSDDDYINLSFNHFSDDDYINLSFNHLSTDGTTLSATDETADLVLYQSYTEGDNLFLNALFHGVSTNIIHN